MGQMVPAGESPSCHSAWLIHRPSYLTSCAPLPRGNVIREPWGDAVKMCFAGPEIKGIGVSFLLCNGGEERHLVHQLNTMFWSQDPWTWEREEPGSWWHKISHNKPAITSLVKEGYFGFVTLKWEHRPKVFTSVYPALAGSFQAIGPSIWNSPLVTMDHSITQFCIPCPALLLVCYLLACQIKSLPSAAYSHC